jgi:8-oxo-dGTP diphosphatase
MRKTLAIWPTEDKQDLSMTLPGQRVQSERYQLIPRTLVFLLRGNAILLVKIAVDRGAWAGLYNGVGGHIEVGENPHSAATREIQEETGIVPDDLRLCGVINVHTGSSPGIGIHVFVGEVEIEELQTSKEGEPKWISLEKLNDYPLVADLPYVIPRALDAYRKRQTFCGLTTFDESGQPILQFLP